MQYHNHQDAEGMDEFVAEHEDMLVLMSAGNQGPEWQVTLCVWS